MLIQYPEIQNGSAILFKSTYPSKVLSDTLTIFDKDWRKVKEKPWHVGFLVSREIALKYIIEHPDEFPQYQDGVLASEWWVCESLSKGITLNPLVIYHPDNYKLYQWFDKPLDEDLIYQYLEEHIGCGYDPLVYLWTIGATIASKMFNINIGVWNNENFTCWENLEEFCSFIGKPICKKNRTITICDIYKALAGV